MTSVAVAVNGGSGVGGKGSRRAVLWAVENLSTPADRFVLVHVMPAVTCVPTPSGDRIPVKELDENVVALYVQDVKEKVEEEIFMPFKKLCKTPKIETLVLEDDNPATALLRFVSQYGINTLVLGSCSPNYITRRKKGPGVPTTVLKCDPVICDIHVVSKDEIITKSVQPSPKSEFKAPKTFKATSVSGLGVPYAKAFEHAHSMNASLVVGRDHEDFGQNHLTITTRRSNSTLSSGNEQAEVERLRLELQNTVSMYKQACEELVHTHIKVRSLSSECLEEAKRVDAALEREEALWKIAAQEEARYLQTMKEVDEAKNLLAKEAYGRQMAELNAIQESSEKQKIVDALFSNDKRYRRYSMDEIEVATDFFSESKVIGEGGYGKVYKCNLNHTPVAIKVLRHDAANKDEFLREVEVLSQLRHPHMVSLLGACPESGCLVYEYLENGSLEECMFHRNGKPPLSWFVRFRILYEVACGLSFLHNSKPEPIVHRDLKPGNILLDRNYVSKIGDVGLSKLISDIVPDNITEYRNSVLAGTLQYMDPEYLRTGTIRPKSDLYAFGVIVLQVLTARHPNGLLLGVENAITYGSFADMLDRSVTDWPFAETLELAQIALKCLKLKCRDRPDLDTEVLPVLKKLVDVVAASVKVERSNNYAPGHYFCPILQEIMDDPHIAADGFTYEHRAIKAWIEKHDVSPVTKLRLKHSTVTPNHTLRSAIQEWKAWMNFKGL